MTKTPDKDRAVDCTTNQKSNLDDFLKSLQSNKLIEYHQFDKKKIMIGLGGPELTAQSFSQVLTKLTEYFTANQYKPVCHQCEKEKIISFAALNNKITNVCSDCFDTIASAARQKPANILNYLAGFIGAVIGGIAGSVLWILIGALGFYAAIAGFVIAFCAFFGYKLFKGPQTMVSIFLVIVAILGSLNFADIGLAIAIMKEVKDVSFFKVLSIIPPVLQEEGVLMELFPNFALGLLFAGLGSFQMIKNTLKEIEKKNSITIERV